MSSLFLLNSFDNMIKFSGLSLQLIFPLLFILYEVSIVIARLGYRKFLVAEQKRMAEEKVEEQNNQVEALLAEQRKQMEQLNN